MAENRFLLPVDDYQRSIDPIGDWIKQTALYASKMTGKPYARCVEHLRQKLRDKTIPFHNPTVVFFERGENGDREKTSMGLVQYIQSTLSANDVLAPTFTTYLSAEKERSFIVEYLDLNVGERKKYKKLSQKYEAEGNVPKYKYYHNAQDNKKRVNNAVSGGFVAEGSVIQNKSAHSTLTSTTRSISSLSNASNERIIEGNRHYYNPQIALNNLISILSETNHAQVDLAIQTFGLVYPTIEDTVACVKRSTDLYHHHFDHQALVLITRFIATMTPTERASVVYTGDLYHLRVLNDAFMRQFITDFARQGQPVEIDNPIQRIHQTDEMIVNYAHQVCLSRLAGIGKDYEKISREDQLILADTCRNIEDAIEKYQILLKAFLLTKNSPATIATIPNMIRRTVVLSDTDSTMFATDHWVEWYFGQLRFDDPGYAVGGAVMFMATQSIAHILALFSANLGVERKRLFSLAMKPEYVFPVFAQTSVAKHYYTAMKVKEGSVYKDIKMEIKGVHMKDSTVPTNIIEGAAKEMEAIIREIMQGKKISLLQRLKATADLERSILASIYKGETTYLKRIKIKELSAYKRSEEDVKAGIDKTPYQYYSLWQQAFMGKYGECPKPPYQAVRIPLDLPNPSAITEWLNQMDDKAVSTAIARWMLTNKKVALTNIPIPIEYCRMHGVPAELASIVDSRRIVLTLTRSYRNVLESLGFYSKRDLLISEQGY